MDNKHKHPHLELILKIVNDEYTPTLEDLINITGNKYLDITIPNGIKLVKYYYGLSQIVIDEKKLEKVISSKPFLFSNPKQKTKLNRRTRHASPRSSLIHPTDFRQPIMVAGAYKGTYDLSNETVLLDNFKEYLRLKLDEYKIDLNKDAITGKYMINGEHMKEILQDIFHVNDMSINTEINEIIDSVLINFISTKKGVPSMSSYNQYEYDISLGFIFNGSIYTRINNDNLLDLLVKKLYGYYNNNIIIGQNIGGDDVLCKYYTYPNCVHISNADGTNYYGMQKLIPIESGDSPATISEKKFNYIIIMNFLRLRYKMENYVNINIANDYEERIWKWGLGGQIAPSGNLVIERPSKYFHLEILDMTSFTIRDAIYLLKLFEEDEMPTIFHCAAGFGRTGSNILLLSLAKTLCSYLSNWHYYGEKTYKDTAINIVTDLLCQPNFDNIRDYLIQTYNDINGTIIDEVIELTSRLGKGDDDFYYTLLYHRMNTIKVAILYYITKKGLYIDEFEVIPFTLHWFNSNTNSSQMIKTDYKLDSFTAIMKLLNSGVPDFKQKLFRCQDSDTSFLKGLDILDGTNFPDTLDEIGPDYPHNPSPLATIVPGGGKINVNVVSKKIQQTKRQKRNCNRNKKKTRTYKHNKK